MQIEEYKGTLPLDADQLWGEEEEKELAHVKASVQAVRPNMNQQKLEDTAKSIVLASKAAFHKARENVHRWNSRLPQILFWAGLSLAYMPFVVHGLGPDSWSHDTKVKISNCCWETVGASWAIALLAACAAPWTKYSTRADMHHRIVQVLEAVV